MRSGPYPLLPRLLVGALAVLVLSDTAGRALFSEAQGLPRTAQAQWLVGGAFAIVLALVALLPQEVEAFRPRGGRLDLARPSHFGALVAAAGALFLVVGLAGVVDTVRGLEIAGQGGDPFPETSQAQVLVGVAVNGLVLVGAPLLWVAALHGDVPAVRALGFSRVRALRAFGLGVAFALASILLVAAIVTVLSSLGGVEVPVNERALGIGTALTPAGAFLVAAGSALVEEVFFRGWLQRRIGLLPQAVVFAIAHLNYLNVGETVAVFALALVFGGLFRATKNLWAPIGAHFAFNFVMLLAASYAPIPP